MTKAKVIAIIVVGVIVSYFIGTYIATEHQLTRQYQRYETQVVCGQAMRTGDFEDCHVVQNTYNTEFICQDASNTAQCWTEL